MKENKTPLIMMRKSIFVFLIILCVVILLPIIPGFTLYKLQLVRSGSMAPALRKGSIIVITQKKTYNRGDVITFQRYEPTNLATVTHRIVDVASSEKGDVVFYTKGDANEERDPFGIEQKEVIGAVVAHIPYIGYVFETLRTPMGFILLLIVPVLYFVYDEIKKITKEFKRLKPTHEEEN